MQSDPAPARTPDAILAMKNQKKSVLGLKKEVKETAVKMEVPLRSELNYEIRAISLYFMFLIVYLFIRMKIY